MQVQVPMVMLLKRDKIGIITQDTHVWDDEVNVKDIFVTIGKTLKLENVSLNSIGSIQIHGETEWLKFNYLS